VAAHLTTLDQAAAHQRLRRRAPRRHHAVRHRQERASSTDPGYFPGAATGILYDRLARFDIGPGATLTARLEAIGYDLADVRTAVLSHLHQNHIGGLPELERRPGARISR
jgi:metal-dependent hydrolase (beta-lactamase superfamily II)